MDEFSSPDPRPDDAESAVQAFAFVRELVSLGVRDWIISPGSRSTPIILALERIEDLRTRVILDERSAAFFALGVADRTGNPVALVCTSGTAGANYYPAVVEASERNIPLLLLTADRPPELRDCGAGQTIDQIGLFGKYVRWEVDAIAPSGRQGEDRLRAWAGEGFCAAVGENPGPVHFNLPFREPFLPGDTKRERIVEKRRRAANPSKNAFDWSALRKSGPGLILVGAANPTVPETWVDGLFRLSDYLGWPIFADVLNPIRHAPGAEERVVTQYEGLISGGSIGKDPALQPRAILQVGILPTAKSLRQWLEGFEGPRWQWSLTSRRLDPTGNPFTWIKGTPADLGELPEDFAPEEYRATWLEWERVATGAVAGWLEGVSDGFEGKIYRRLAQIVPADGQVFVANSMPVRDAERFWFADRPRGPKVFSNRGASGIDGLVSTVAGLADGGPPTLAILGDLAFLHDSGGLRAAAAIEGSLTFVVIDNGGGRIFEKLPIRSREDVFDRYFLTPQNVDIVQLCSAHGIRVDSVSEITRLVELAKDPSEAGVRVILFRADVATDSELRAEWRQLFEKLDWEKR